MRGSIKIIPTIVPSALADVREVSEHYGSFANFFQIDIADGIFAPNTTWLPATHDVLPKEYEYEVHMMVSNPLEHGTRSAKAGARALIAHAEALESIEKSRSAFGEWRRAGVEKIGLAVLFRTPFSNLDQYMPEIDFVLLMTIARIGVQGIAYEASASARVAEFHMKHPDIVIAVDGGVSKSNIEELARAGATRFGVGSAIAKAADPAKAYRELKALAESSAI